MENKMARVISSVFHPLFVPLYILLFLLNINVYFALIIPFSFKLFLTGVIILTTLLIPMGFFFLLYRKKLVHTFFMETREERIYPLLITGIFYYLTYYLLKNFQISPIFSFYMLGASFLVLLALVITFYRKISLHMIGAGGTFGLMLGLSFNLSLDLLYFLFTVLILSGLVGYARLQTNSHKPSEIYTGFLVGAVVMFLLFFLI
ncbi:MAG: hypothetical protein NTX61_14685 [Bacteroidetes bacterium]|nr:hypothetical protein [Bacteroidota bacterium]